MPNGRLEAGDVAAYLVGRGLLPAGTDAAIEELAGGVSCAVFGVRWASGAVVVKQARRRLRVAADWTADPRRATTEAEALRRCHRLTPDAVPRLLDADAARHALTLERAPDDWRTWKAELLAGTVRTDVARRLGAVLARWHGGTWHGGTSHGGTSHGGTPGAEPLPAVFHDPTGFEELRLRPFHETVRDRHPADAARLTEVLEGIRSRRLCLVHGDFSPKNVVVGPAGLWVVDFEVAHLGDPTFDLAFLLTHLVLKAVHLPGHAGALAACAEEFLGSYREKAPPELWPDPDWLTAQLGCLLLARVDGKSPAEYLAAAEVTEVRRRGLALLRGESGVSGVFGDG